MIVRRHKGENGKGYKKSQNFRFAGKEAIQIPDRPDVRAQKDAMIETFFAEHPEKRLQKNAP